MIKKINFKSDFIKSVAVLMTGTMAAQMLGYLFAPIITRYYDPSEGAELGLLLNLVAVGAAFATARYELTLPVVKSNVHAFRLYHVTLRITIIVTVLSFLILLYPLFTKGANLDFLYYSLIPIAIFLTASSNTGTYWAIRFKFFKHLSYSKIATSISSNLVKVSLGFIGMGYMGLVIGALTGLVFGNIWFVKNFFKGQSEYEIQSGSPRNFVLAKQYIEFPKINMPHVILDVGKVLMITALIWHFYSKHSYGLYDHSFRMLRLPLIFIGTAIGPVFLQKCAEMFNADKPISPFIRKTMLTLFLLSITPFTVIFFYGGDIFAFVFSDKWRGAGTFSEIMAPWFMMIFIASPISSLPTVIGRQREFFGFAILGTSMMIGAASIPPYFYNASIEQTLWILSLSQSAYFVLVIFKYLQYAKKADVR
ncbi:MAG: oligosaccharide flippase family protein [Crocinitomicaceae bacterium]|nr:oligosaccharide flippase family protein [Crocinitomicaceae bacterium]